MPMMGTIIEAPSLKTSWAVATQALLMAMMSPAQNQNHQATSSACAGINANVAPSCFKNGNRPDHKHQCYIENSQALIVPSAHRNSNKHRCDVDDCTYHHQEHVPFDGGTQEDAAEAYDIQPCIIFGGTNAVTNFDISLYDMKRICSSSPAHLDHDYNSCASSSSLQALLAMTNGKTSEDFTNMVWSSNMPERQDPPIQRTQTLSMAMP
ncbi:hypothetical protein NL676_028233 [Syzygium grande]|nr:hypothetical protein NL676_028233 [Syzygium grande]